MNVTEVEDMIVRHLAETMGTDRGALTAQLSDAGAEWPCDSLVLAEVVVILEEELDFELPMDDETSKALRTVKGLARRICDTIYASEREPSHV